MLAIWAGLAEGAEHCSLLRGGWRDATQWDILLWQQQPLKSAEPWSVNSPSEPNRNLTDSFYKANTCASVFPLREICQDRVFDNVHSSKSNQSPFGSGSFLTRWAEQNKLNLREGLPFVKQPCCQAWLAATQLCFRTFWVLLQGLFTDDLRPWTASIWEGAHKWEMSFLKTSFVNSWLIAIFVNSTVINSIIKFSFKGSSPETIRMQ